jgi:hypothetical protein
MPGSRQTVNYELRMDLLRLSFVMIVPHLPFQADRLKG